MDFAAPRAAVVRGRVRRAERRARRGPRPRRALLRAVRAGADQHQRRTVTFLERSLTGRPDRARPQPRRDGLRHLRRRAAGRGRRARSAPTATCSGTTPAPTSAPPSPAAPPSSRGTTRRPPAATCCTSARRTRPAPPRTTRCVSPPARRCGWGRPTRTCRTSWTPARVAAPFFQLVGFEALLVRGPFSAQSEYALVPVDARAGGNVCFQSWYVLGSVFLTGENRTYRKSHRDARPHRAAPPLRPPGRARHRLRPRRLGAGGARSPNWIWTAAACAAAG